MSQIVKLLTISFVDRESFIVKAPFYTQLYVKDLFARLQRKLETKYNAIPIQKQ